jgi:hypothetical protein
MLLTAFSLVLVLVTLPFSLCVSVKASNPIISIKGCHWNILVEIREADHI